MNETGILNADIAGALACMGHMDECMVVDAGFPIPDGPKRIDLAISENQPTVMAIIEELKKHFSVEKIVLAQETKDFSPSRFDEVVEQFSDAELEVIPHTELKKRSKSSKFIIRTGDFTACSNVLLVSGGGPRWYVENA